MKKHDTYYYIGIYYSRKLQKYCEEKGFLVDKQNKVGTHV